MAALEKAIETRRAAEFGEGHSGTTDALRMARHLIEMDDIQRLRERSQSRTKETNGRFEQKVAERNKFDPTEKKTAKAKKAVVKARAKGWQGRHSVRRKAVEEEKFDFFTIFFVCKKNLNF